MHPIPNGNQNSSTQVRDTPKTWLDGGIALLDRDGRVLNANESLATWLGASPSTLKGQLLAGLLGKRHPGWQEPLESFLRLSEGFDCLELSGQNDSGLEHLRTQLCSQSDRRFLHLETVMPPLTEFEKLFPESHWGCLTSDRAFQRVLCTDATLGKLSSWPGMFFSQRPDFSFIFISPKIEELTGIRPSEFCRSSNEFLKVVHEADVESVKARLSSKEEGYNGSKTFRLRHGQTGRITYIGEHRRAIRTENGLLLGFEGIWLDITRQTIAERRLLNMAGREDLGILTQGLAHDFCNIMTGIVGLSETFEGSLPPENPMRSGLRQIRESAMQAGRLAHRIRQLNQGKPGEPNYQDLNESVRSLLDLLQKALPRRVHLSPELAPGQLPLYVDLVELQQVIINLALNAADAMPEGGQLILRTQRHQQAISGQILQGAPPAGPVISLSVQDTGNGIPAGILDSIFNPFVTTKPIGKGSGLGLYNARLFAEKHGAAISVDTTEGVGSTFHLWFAEAHLTEGHEATPPRPRRHDTVLVAGRPTEQLQEIVQLLRGNGFYAVTANNDAAAIETLHAPDFQVNALVVLTDGTPAEQVTLCQRVRAHKLPLKTLLALMRGKEGKLPEDLLQAVDAVLNFDAGPKKFLQRLRQILNEQQ